MSTITVPRAALGKAVTFASLGLARRPVVPVLAGMRATITAGALELAAFDYEVHATVKVPGDGDGTAGTALVNGRELAEAIRSLPATGGTRKSPLTAAVTITGAGLTVESSGVTVTVTAFGPEAEAEYPAFPPLPPLSGVIDAALFARAVARVAACAGRDDTLPVLTCVLVKGTGGGMLELAGTDRYRLGIERQPWTGPELAGVLVPAVTLVKFAKACDQTGKASLYLGDAGDGRVRAGLSDGTRTLVTATNSGEFPRYRQFAGKPDGTYPTVITVNGKALAAAVTRAGDVTGRNEPVGLTAGGNGITLTGRRDGKVTSTQQVTATVTGPDAETGFNAVYLASVTAGIPGDARIEVPAPSLDVIVAADGGRTEVPVIRTPSRVTSGDGFTAIVVPIRLAA